MSKKKLKRRNIINRHLDLTSQEKSIVNSLLSTYDSIEDVTDEELQKLALKYGPKNAIRLLENLQSKIEKAQEKLDA